jgi:non-ribosomal peptide synthetase component F
LFNDTLRAFPETIAVEEDGGSITFSELLRNADAICDHLVEGNITADQIVPILFGLSVNMVVAMLSIMKAGATYCPVDVDGPDLRLRQALTQVAATVIAGDRVNGDRLSKELWQTSPFSTSKKCYCNRSKLIQGLGLFLFPIILFFRRPLAVLSLPPAYKNPQAVPAKS